MAHKHIVVDIYYTSRTELEVKLDAKHKEGWFVVAVMNAPPVDRDSGTLKCIMAKELTT